MSNDRYHRRERRKAKVNPSRRPKKSGVVGHGSNLPETIIDNRAARKSKRRKKAKIGKIEPEPPIPRSGTPLGAWLAEAGILSGRAVGSEDEE